ncbi:hypothetical protein ACWEKT_26455 [Nocardia takedensis]
MSWPASQPGSPTDPAYYHDAADEREAQLRADFARYHYLNEIAPYGETPEQITELTTQARTLSQRWTGSGDATERGLWTQLDSTTAAWEARPETTRAAYQRLARAHAAGDQLADELTWRTLHQTAVLTGRIEPGITGSVQDSARSRPHDRGNVIELRPTSAADRALGGRGSEISMDEIDAIIAATDELLDAEELDGDRDTGVDQRDVRRQTALRRVQDLSAEYASTSTRFTGVVNHDQALIERLDGLLDHTRAARAEAFRAGATHDQIDLAYVAGRDGTYARASTEPDPTDADRIDAAVSAAIPADPGDTPGAEPDATADVAPEPSPDIEVTL